jgi:hypothetical protein
MSALAKRPRRAAALFLALSAAALCLAAPASARDLEFPVFSTPGLNPNLSPSSAPGGRPFELIDVFALNQTPTLEGVPGPAANLRDISVELPPGIVANAATFPRCSQEAFNADSCATLDQVGVANLDLSAGLSAPTVPVFNLAPPPGQPAQFAFRVLGSAVHVDFRIRGGSDYGATATVNGLGEAAGLLGSELRIWGVPGDPAHDALRFTGNGTSAPGSYPEAAPYRPLLSNPTSCNGPLVTTIEASTWQAPGQPVAAAPFEAPGIGECNQLDFEPILDVKPTTNLADSPSGLDLHLNIRQNQDWEGAASGQLRSARIVLPAGLALNPAAANGLGTCSPEQIGLAAAANERQLLRYDLPPVNFSGTFTVTYAGHTTAPIPATAARAQVAAALETLPGLAGNLSVSGAKGGWIVAFTGALAGTDVPLLSGNVTDNPSQIIAVTGEGGSYKLESGGAATAPLPFDASPLEIQEALRSIPALGLGNLYPANIFVDGAGSEESTRFFRAIFAGDLAGTKPLLTATSALTGPGAGVTFTPADPPPPRSLSVAAFGANAPGTPQFTPAPPACPDSSKIGTVRIDSPALLDHPLFGDVFLASPDHNPFGSLLAIYLAVVDPATGIVLKLPARVESDPGSGRLTATLAEAPQLPFEDLRIELFKGTAAPLRTPLACGTYAVATEITPWGAPEAAVRRPTDSFQMVGGAGAGTCVKDAAAAPETSRFEAGTIDPSAGIYSPFTLKLARADGTAPLRQIDTTLPPGLLARLTGRATCPDAALATAAARSAGAERAAPSCPAASRVGSLNVAAGAGPSPLNLLGNAYLAGPYKGAPLSLATVTPALAGPFDLGTVVLRTALYIDPLSTRVHAVSDPFPASLRGIGLDLRSVALNLDAAGFAKNPTSCNALAFAGAAPAQSARFQVGDCGTLAFKPKLELALKGETERGAHPALAATLTYPAKGNPANLAAASLLLPKALGFDKSHLRGRGPYGSVKLTTPLLPGPLQGPLYLRRAGTKAPLQLTADLHGAIDVVLHGRLEQTKRGALLVGFEDLPDAPISKLSLELKGGKRGLLQNAADLCAAPPRALALLDAQSGQSVEQRPTLTTGCKAKKQGKAPAKDAEAKGRSGSGGDR